MVKNPPANAGEVRDAGSIPGSGKSPEGGNGNSLQYSCLEKIHGQKSLVGYSPEGHKELDRIEHARIYTQGRFKLYWSPDPPTPAQGV